ncbi:MAG: hypothetical protein EAX86_01505 [Candidatus Heimdallarchaeota archaeon]|nr:hypothetical protein [Candidatus Heimdallarchaeota archaeon]
MNQISHLTLPEFKIVTPSTLREALSILDTNNTRSKLLAGGTDLLVDLRNRTINPNIIIDLKNIPELNELKQKGDIFVIGAAVPIADILKSKEVRKNFHSLYTALNEMCDEILRFRATIGGNLGTASPAADTAGPLLIHRARIIVASKKISREIPIQEFFIGVKQNCLMPNEIITAIHIPISTENEKSVFLKLKRNSEDLALIGVSAINYNSQTKLAFTAVAPIPILVDITAYISGNKRPNEEKFKEIWKLVKNAISPINDLRASREYRLHMTEILTRKALKEVLQK